MSLYVPLFKALNDAGVKYVVVGGLATVLHGYARLTMDVDLMATSHRRRRGERYWLWKRWGLDRARQCPRFNSPTPRSAWNGYSRSE